jgi:hypothetical protein
MLSINNHVVARSDHREHAWALRTIGQNLADLKPDYVEIEFNGHVYIARGHTRTSQRAEKKSRAGKILGVFRRRGKRSTAQRRESPWFERRYSVYEINHLDERRLTQRKGGAATPDIYVLGERLRTIGKMIEVKGGQLLKLTLDNTRVEFSYRDGQGAIHHEEHSTPALYQSQQDGHRSRGSGRNRDPWVTHQARGAVFGSGATKGKFRLRPDSTTKRRTRRGEDNER